MKTSDKKRTATERYIPLLFKHKVTKRLSRSLLSLPNPKKIDNETPIPGHNNTISVPWCVGDPRRDKLQAAAEAKTFRLEFWTPGPVLPWGGKPKLQPNVGRLGRRKENGQISILGHRSSYLAQQHKL